MTHKAFTLITKQNKTYYFLDCSYFDPGPMTLADLERTERRTQSKSQHVTWEIQHNASVEMSRG